jgi:hypothetical protein
VYRLLEIMSILRQVSDWGYRKYQLEEIDVPPECTADITFPDGTVERHIIHIARIPYTDSDHGHVSNATHFKPYILVPYHGLKVDICLKPGMAIEIVMHNAKFCKTEGLYDWVLTKQKS